VPPVRRGSAYAVEREFAKADYIAAVLRAKEYIAAGDMMQVQIGQRLKKRYTESR
jgi:anthranilate synthase component I